MFLLFVSQGEFNRDGFLEPIYSYMDKKEEKIKKREKYEQSFKQFSKDLENRYSLAIDNEKNADGVLSIECPSSLKNIKENAPFLHECNVVFKNKGKTYKMKALEHWNIYQGIASMPGFNLDHYRDEVFSKNQKRMIEDEIGYKINPEVVFY